jgi:hypothetical protein
VTVEGLAQDPLRPAGIRAILKASREKQMPNHINHPEDEVLTGDLSVLDFFVTPGNLSVKIDGAPAVGFGINPATGKFAVATKSFLNKKKIKIAHSHEEIDAFYQGEVANILHHLFDYAPRQHSVWIQADFIGFSGSKEYTPNTITYQFPDVVEEKIILFPHTIYWGTDNLNTCKSTPIDFQLESTFDCKVIQPQAYLQHDPWSRSEGSVCFDDVEEVCKFARQMAQTVTFVSEKEAARIKQQINACIRAGEEIEDDAFDCDANLIRFWKLIRSIKEDCLFLCRNDGPAAYINGNRIDAEGYVFTNEFGMMKLINREVFAYANFNSGRFQVA